MNIQVISNKKYLEENELSVFFVYEDNSVDLKNEILNAFLKDFEAKYSNIDICKVFTEGKLIDLMLVGLGKKDEVSIDDIRNLGGNISKELKKSNIKEINFLNIKDDLNYREIEALVEGIKLGEYTFDKYKSEKKESVDKNINLNLDESYNDYIKQGELLAEIALISRNLVNEPSNVIYPETLANEVINLGKKYGFETKVYGKEDIEKLGMEAFLAVAKGSDKEPRLIVMKYNGDKESDEILGLVGKGLTYDSGGYSIKPTNSMVDMKTDMGGAAAVIGAMCGISKSKLNKNVIAVVAACENLISGHAYKPGDIINSMGKKTIEILNTDAEGRLTLVDAVYYAINSEKVTKIVDIATLTGAALVALGTVATPIISNNDEFYNKLGEAASLSDEKIWRMPVFEEFKKVLKGKEADLNNSPGRDGGCITAGLFIGEFVGDTPWIHMDIAGTSVSSKDFGYKSKGATGEGARTLYNLAKLI
ncbi:leucyl aminopeptidase [Paraclostridium tenue]|uniref:Probable cytosol aminopeptidase n=1 Tax=Paraclostridium tenue TaxID=1737 RepID=A0ABP3XHX4_9FIRM